MQRLPLTRRRRSQDAVGLVAPASTAPARTPPWSLAPPPAAHVAPPSLRAPPRRPRGLSSRRLLTMVSGSPSRGSGGRSGARGCPIGRAVNGNEEHRHHVDQEVPSPLAHHRVSQEGDSATQEEADSPEA